MQLWRLPSAGGPQYISLSFRPHLSFPCLRPPRLILPALAARPPSLYPSRHLHCLFLLPSCSLVSCPASPRTLQHIPTADAAESKASTAFCQTGGVCQHARREVAIPPGAERRAGGRGGDCLSYLQLIAVALSHPAAMQLFILDLAFDKLLPALQLVVSPPPPPPLTPVPTLTPPSRQCSCSSQGRCQVVWCVCVCVCVCAEPGRKGVEEKERGAGAFQSSKFCS